MNIEYNYYIHRSADSDYKSFFQNGIYDFDTAFKIESTLEKIPDEIIKQGGLENSMKSAFRAKDSTIFLVKIPKAYFPTGAIHRDGNMDIPIPFLYEKTMADPLGRVNTYPIIIPNLIQGCCSKTEGFITNENFSPVFDPSGLKFSYEQLNPIKNERYDLYQQYMKRNTIGTFDALYNFDKSNNTWDKFIAYYSQLFGVTSVSPNFSGDDEAKELH